MKLSKKELVRSMEESLSWKVLASLSKTMGLSYWTTLI